MPWPLLAAIPGIIGAVGGGGAAAGIGAGAAGAAGAAAGGIGAGAGAAGAAGATGAGGMMAGGKGLMGMMGGKGGGGQGGGGMMKGIMGLAKKPDEMFSAAQNGLVDMLNAADGAGIDLSALEYLKKIQGNQPEVLATPPTQGIDPASLAPGANMSAVQPQVLPEGGVQPSIAMPDQTAMPSVQQPMGQPGSMPGPTSVMPPSTMTPENPDSKTSLPGANQGKTGMGGAKMVGSLMGMMGKGEYSKDDRGVTQVTESSNVLGNSISKIDPKNPASLVTAGFALVGGKMHQMSEKRRAVREEAQLGSDFQRAQQASSVYADPNSAYYSAKDGAPINLAGMMKGRLNR